jgi:hypothetical protein
MLVVVKLVLISRVSHSDRKNSRYTAAYLGLDKSYDWSLLLKALERERETGNRGR